MNKRQRYRPTLTREEIAFLFRHLKESYIESFKEQKEDSPKERHEEAMLLSLTKKFAALHAKIKYEVAAPAYTLSPPALNLLERLGELPPATEVTPTTKRRIAYEKFVQVPLSCTTTEIDDAQEYRFQHGLMKPEEAKNYSTAMWKKAATLTTPEDNGSDS